LKLCVETLLSGGLTRRMIGFRDCVRPHRPVTPRSASENARLFRDASPHKSVLFLNHHRPLINWNKMLHAQIDSCLTFLLFRSNKIFARLTQVRSEQAGRRSSPKYLPSLSIVKCVPFHRQDRIPSQRLNGDFGAFRPSGCTFNVTSLDQLVKLPPKPRGAKSEDNLRVSMRNSRVRHFCMCPASFKLRY